MAKVMVEIIYSDDDLLVVNKPSGVSVTKDRVGADELLKVLAVQMGQEAAAGRRRIHRLDKDTSGLMVLAKNSKTQAEFGAFFENRQVKKTYLALVTGYAHENEGVIETLIARAGKHSGLMAVVPNSGKRAVSRWRLLADFGTVALLAVYPQTGRTHQIRIHLPSIGLRLAIDPLYGSGRALFLSDFKTNYRLGKEREEKPLIDRLTLHAYQLQFPESRAERPSVFVAGLDKKFKAAIKMLTKHNPNGPEAFREPGDYDAIINGRPLAQNGA